MPKGKSNGSRRRTPPAGRSAAVAAPPEVLSLVERFRENLESYRDPAYKEARLRREFLDPFFEALGWDLQNKAGHAEAYKDVVHEDALKVGGSTEAPDYGFRVGGQRKFFVEAKKPSVAVGTDVHPAYQLRRYAWSAKLPLAILTDFEELAVYDCRVRPRRTDKSSTARILYMTFEEYAERWGEVAAIFSKEAVLKGSFDRFAEKGRRRGTATVDEAFLEEIEKWRERLARSLALRNPRLSVRDLNAAVQRTIDRIIFLRMCEDRGIEPGGALLALVNGAKIYERLVALFERADDKYNSGLFHFRREPGRDAPDELTPRLRVDDGVLADIIRSLYYPESPYEFSVLGADILGQVYEQFLGKVIRLTAGHHAKVEEKPEVKKAGGVYYTPTYIVRYIVEETVGRLLPAIPSPPLPSVGEGGGEGGGNSPSPLPSPIKGEGENGERPASGPANARERGKVARLRILDPACGSGSFLIGAFERLLDWHRDWYVADGPEKHPKEVYEGAGGQWRLTVREKRRILLNNIFGVDIDGQAVEVTKLSLLLKVLEGENQDSLQRQMRLFHEERALPDLESNIKCGNSLIGPDFFDGRQMDLFEEEEVERVNAFDWEREFPQILSPKVPKKRRGFDAVIGNPPYGYGFKENDREYLERCYVTFVWRGESYMAFVERAHTLLAQGGLFGYIIPDTYLNLGFTAALRQFLLKSVEMRQIVVLPANVFAEAVVDTTLLFTQKLNPQPKLKVEIVIYQRKTTVDGLGEPIKQFRASAEDWTAAGTFLVQAQPRDIAILTKMESKRKTFGDVARISYGIKVYQVGKGNPPQSPEVRDKKPFTSATRLNRSFLPFYDGKHIGRYQLTWNENNWLKYGPWVAEPRSPDQFEGEKILIRKIVGQTLIATYTPDTSYCNTLLYVLKRREGNDWDYRYVLGVLNSRLYGWYIRSKLQITAEDTFPQILIRDILALPFDDKSNARHEIEATVDSMLDLNKRLAKARSVEARGRIQRLIDRTDREIDALVYELYGLTEEEIGIVEEAGE